MGNVKNDVGGEGFEMLLEKTEQKPTIVLEPNPETTASIFSKVTFMFITRFLYKGYWKTLEVEDMYEPLPEHESEAATRRLSIAWNSERVRAYRFKRTPNLTAAVRRAYGKEICLYGVLLFVEEFLKLCQPLLMGRLIRYFRYDVPLTPAEAYAAAGGIAMTAIIFAIVHHLYYYGLQKIGLQVKVATSGMLAKKGLSLSNSALRRATVGHVVNLLSTDVNKFDVGFIFIHHIWVSPLLLIVYSYYLWKEIGPSAFAGFGALVILIPIQGYFASKMGACRKEIASRADKRLSVMNEILNGIRMIKMYVWEDAFTDVVADLRRREMSKVRINTVIQSLVMGLFWSSGKLIVLFAVLCFVLTGNDLSTERIFVAIALYNSCHLSITLFFPFAVQFFFELRVTLRRIQAFLEMEEFTSYADSSLCEYDKEEHCSSEKLSVNDIGIGRKLKEQCAKGSRIVVESLTTTWQTEENSRDVAYAVKDLTFEANSGDLIAVIGPVGSGKSSLLSSLLCETRKLTGKLIIDGKIAYCNQDAWIFNGTVRENILFGCDYDQESYHRALELSALSSDIEQFPLGDAMLVGDRGTSLSGGQRARISLARAIYSNADIFLFDDPLSAVDATVARHLFDRCICGYLRNKVVVLVTHQFQFLHCASKVLLMKKGEIVASGTFEELKEGHAEHFTELVRETEDSFARITSTERGPSMGGSPKQVLSRVSADPNDGCAEVVEKSASYVNEEGGYENESLFDNVPEIEEGEEKAAGAVAWKIYAHYVEAMCSNPFVVLTLLFLVFGAQVLFNMTDWWLNKWANAAERKAAALAVNSTVPQEKYTFLGFEWTVELSDYMHSFTVLTLLLMVFSVIRAVWFRFCQTIASINFHRKMFSAVINTKVAFFDKNPIGRILNRFSKDVNMMDDHLSFVFFEFFMGLLSSLGAVFVIFLINPLVILPTIPLLVIFVVVRSVYLASSRDVQRLEATTRSPLYSHISAFMNGLSTVRAFGRQKNVLNKYYRTQNMNTAAFALTLSTSRWFAICIDSLVAFFVTAVAFFSVSTPGPMRSGDVALMLVYAVQLIGFFSWIMRQSADLQNGMVSIERIIQYTELESEHDNGALMKVPEGWPTEGHITMNNVFLRYDDNSEYVLRNICLDIKPMEKIGIVGRTGSGKSSLLRALFRLTAPSSGTITIDDVDTALIPLKVLRRGIAIIPQVSNSLFLKSATCLSDYLEYVEFPEPVLFMGSLRLNLDPFKDYSDEELWSVIKQVELESVLGELGGGLETSMHEGGVNFSVGQRQLVCLARALLRNSRILVIDEATANVDPRTDTLIQRTIRESFSHATVMTIAHRLHTIVDANRILVLKDGEVAEFAPAYELLQNPSGVLASLVKETGQENATLLHKIAEENYSGRLK